MGEGVEKAKKLISNHLHSVRDKKSGRSGRGLYVSPVVGRCVACLDAFGAKEGADAKRVFLNEVSEVRFRFF